MLADIPQRTEGRNRPRLFICPTGMFTFLPVHAAGIYEGSAGTCLSDFCVVSYAPTLGALTRECNPVARQNTRLFLAAAPAPPTMHALPAAKREAELVTTIVPRTVLMANADATADDVIRLLADATILHLACHGKQNAGKPLESGFVMQDRMIQIADLIRLDLPKARLAFLSACETAQGDTARPDEALHLAAAMLFAGFKSVVGTLWSMDDVDGPVVAEAVYRELFAGNGEELDFDCVPYALDDAVRKLRERGYEVSRWATYVHIGM
jgi:CHAT domain-containing protein